MHENLSRPSCPFVGFVIHNWTLRPFDKAQDQRTTSLGDGAGGDDYVRAQVSEGAGCTSQAEVSAMLCWSLLSR